MFPEYSSRLQPRALVPLEFSSKRVPCRPAVPTPSSDDSRFPQCFLIFISSKVPFLIAAP